MNTKRPTIVFFFGFTKLSHQMLRQARTGDTVLVKSKEMLGRAQTMPWWLGGRQKKNTLVLLVVPGGVGPWVSARLSRTLNTNP